MNTTKKSILFASTALIAVTSCKSLKLDKNSYTVTPSPLELVGDSVRVKIEGMVPAKTFHPKATAVFTPTIKTVNGNKTLKPMNLYGAKVKDAKGTMIDWKTGGKISYTDVIAYTPEMRDAKLIGNIEGKLKSKTKTYNAELAEATITTQQLVMNDQKAIMAKDAMPKMVTFNTNADILYTINSETVRPAELKAEDVVALDRFIAEGSTNAYTIKGVSIASYASPDGIETKNADLATNRGNTAATALKAMFKKYKLEAGTQDGFYTKTATPEDWEGFKELMNQSKIGDKEMILRILTTYPDLEVREKEMKNISKAYTELADDIFPKLRRSKIAINAEKACKTDDELKQLSISAADKLTVEEMLYAANLQTDLTTKATIYKTAQTRFVYDWRPSNNLGGVYLMQNKVSDAKAEFEKADKLNPNNTTVQNNLGVVAHLMGDKTTAEAMYKKATGAGAEVNHNMANLQIAKGEYSQAVSNFGGDKSFNAALANLLAGNKDQALTVLEASKDNSTAMGYYLKAVINARMGNATSFADALKAAINKDASLKNMAKSDKEFAKFASQLAGM
jgi:tetratricopeptide (TPR) repeat protein